MSRSRTGSVSKLIKLLFSVGSKVFFFQTSFSPPLQVGFERFHHCVIPSTAAFLMCHVSPPRKENRQKIHRPQYYPNSTRNDARYVVIPNTLSKRYDRHRPVFLCLVKPSSTYFFLPTTRATVPNMFVPKLPCS